MENRSRSHYVLGLASAALHSTQSATELEGERCRGSLISPSSFTVDNGRVE